MLIRSLPSPINSRKLRLLGFHHILVCRSLKHSIDSNRLGRRLHFDAGVYSETQLMLDIEHRGQADSNILEPWFEGADCYFQGPLHPHLIGRAFDADGGEIRQAVSGERSADFPQFRRNASDVVTRVEQPLQIPFHRLLQIVQALGASSWRLARRLRIVINYPVEHGRGYSNVIVYSVHLSTTGSRKPEQPHCCGGAGSLIAGKGVKNQDDRSNHQSDPKDDGQTAKYQSDSRIIGQELSRPALSRLLSRRIGARRFPEALGGL